MENNSSEFILIHLKQAEIENPLLVLADFFSDDWLPGHLARLKEWRRCALSNEHFKGDTGSPGALLYFHKLNICLLEALWLLKNIKSSFGGHVSPGQIIKEKETWRDVPITLDERLLLEPALYLTGFFEDYTLQRYRDMLYEWLEYGLSLEAAGEFIDASELIKVYENLQTAYNVAWVIHQRTSDKPYLKHGSPVNIERPVANRPVVLYELNREINLEKQALLSQVVSIIKHKVPSTEAIFYLGIDPAEAGRHFLLILTANDEKETALSLGSCVEESCAKVTGVVALVHHVSRVINFNDHDNRFYNHAMNGPVLYLSGKFSLPVSKPIVLQRMNSADAAIWQRWHKQGLDLLKGAEYYRNIGAGEAALFSLHQCTECLLIAVIRLVLGYRMNNHNLKKLLDVTQMFTGEIYELFNVNDGSGAQDFRVLQHAYVNVRYKDIYEADAKTPGNLYPKVCDLVKLTEKLYHSFVAANIL